MTSDAGAHHYDATRVEQVCDAVHRAATSGTPLDGAITLVTAVTDGDRDLAAEALSTCARRSLQDADGWFQAARLLERALDADEFDGKPT